MISSSASRLGSRARIGLATFMLLVLTAAVAVCAPRASIAESIGAPEEGWRQELTGLDPGMAQSLKFSFRNRLKVALSAPQIVASCGCLMPRFEPSTVPVDGVGILTVSARLANKFETYEGAIAIMWADGSESALSIGLRCARSKEVVLLPQSISDRVLGSNEFVDVNMTIDAYPVRSCLLPSSGTMDTALVGCPATATCFQAQVVRWQYIDSFAVTATIRLPTAKLLGHSCVVIEIAGFTSNLEVRRG